MTKNLKYKALFSLPVIIAALGYFVDIYDLVLFGVVRVESLKDLGLDPTVVGELIINWQMIGLLLGGLLWGILGDKKGRLSVLFGSILVYSVANILCGFIPQMNFMDTTFLYCLLRFIAGVGLAGELGAGITLVSESLPKELRAIGTSLVAGFGLLGAVVAKLTVGLSGSWEVTYMIGGGLGLVLLFLRLGVVEPSMYENMEVTEKSKGDFFLLFKSKERFLRYLKCILIGVPTWYCVGIFAFFGNEFSEVLGTPKEIDAGMCVLWVYSGISIGDFFSGFISHWLHSRKKSIVLMLLFTAVGVLILVSGLVTTVWMYYAMMVWLGLGTGYWAMFVTMGAEQFGTNIRATAATTIPNFVRGTVPLINLCFFAAISSLGMLGAAAVVGVVVFGLAFYSVLSIPETHNTSLDFIEE